MIRMVDKDGDGQVFSIVSSSANQPMQYSTTGTWIDSRASLSNAPPMYWVLRTLDDQSHDVI